MEQAKTEILDAVSQALQRGRVKLVQEGVHAALEAGLSAQEILSGGLLPGMDVVGEKFKKNEVYVPEVMIAARAMTAGTELLKPYLAKDGPRSAGKVCIGTVRGDMHDIGKNLVKMMMEGKGLEVLDLGTNVSPQRFLDAAVNEHCRIVACSALLTTTMPVMREVVEAFMAAGKREEFFIMVGGAPVTQAFCDEIGADSYTPDAASAADAALDYCRGKTE